MTRWKATGRTVTGDGGTTICYEAEGIRYTVESRKRQIPHANGVGTWAHTSYFVLGPDGGEKERHTLKDAKALAERMELYYKEG